MNCSDPKPPSRAEANTTPRQSGTIVVALFLLQIIKNVELFEGSVEHMWKAQVVRVGAGAGHVDELIKEQVSMLSPVPHELRGLKVAKFLVVALHVATLWDVTKRNRGQANTLTLRDFRDKPSRTRMPDWCTATVKVANLQRRFLSQPAPSWRTPRVATCSTAIARSVTMSNRFLIQKDHAS